MDRTAKGWINGMLGVAIFAGSLPATRVAVASFDPVFLTAARAAIAGLAGLVLLVGFRQRAPGPRDVAALAAVAFGVVLGFPLLTALALRHMTSAHSIVFIGLLPLATALFGVMRAGDRPHPAFWAFSLAGGALVVGFALAQSAAVASRGDLLMLAAVLVCGFGYAEGARLARRLGGWQVICWALVVALPFMLALTLATWPEALPPATAPAWLGLGYVSLFSMLIGFVFWYRGLAQGGVAAVGQLQLLQPFLGLALAGLILREPVSPAMLAATLGVVACVAGARAFSAAPTGQTPVASSGPA